MDRLVYASPPFTESVPDTVLIVGAAPCLYEDVAEAQRLRPAAQVFAINEAGAALKHIDHLLCGHAPNAGAYIAERFMHQPLGSPDYRAHACWEPGLEHITCVQHWWHHAKGQATSAWSAVRIAKAMGFSEVILCGCPLDTSGYFNDGYTHATDEGVPRVGYDDQHPTCRRYRERFAAYAQTEGEGVRSMSGWTREILGAPQWMH